MTSSLPKLAAVFFMICSVAFMGLAVASYFGRPDPIAEISSPALSNYAFDPPATAEGSWTVTPAVGDNKSPTTHGTAYAAIVDAYKKEATRLSADANSMTDITARLSDLTNAARTDQVEDMAAVDRRIDEMNKILVDANASYTQASLRLQKLSVETQQVRDETSERREDVLRLQNELEELRTDRYRLEGIRRVLTDRLVRLQLDNQALDTRIAEVESAQQ